MQQASLPKGTRDFSPAVMLRRNYITDTIKSVYRAYGFDPIETPAMENLSTLTGKYGLEGDKLLFKILNSGDYLAKADANALTAGDSARLVSSISEKGLRYDLTVPFARYVVQNQSNITFPFRRYQIQPVWRADRPQKGRYREFWQCDADVIGTKSLLCEADFINIYHAIFTKLGLSNYQVRINHRKVLEAIAVTIDYKGSFTDLTIAIDKLDKIGWDGVSKELLGKGLSEANISTLQSLLVVKTFNRDTINELSQVLVDCPEKTIGLQELEDVLNFGTHEDVTIALDLSLARGLDYYTGCIFEAVIQDSGIGSVSGGGRYDDLTGIFGLKDVSGVGISFGLDRLYDIMLQSDLFTDDGLQNKILFCHFDKISMQYCIEQANKLRTSGLTAVVYPDHKKIKKQFDYANKSGFNWVAVVGDNEIKDQVVQLKNMTTGQQDQVSIENLIEHLS
ncbi:MAG: histidyl-tRNA synthetase [Bacteroidia bacterium]|jgi:histidyl-tRNA synthetase